MTPETAKLYARMPEHRAKIKESIIAVKVALKKGDGWAVAFSGGKDATALFFLVESVAPGACKIVFFDDEINFPETVDYLNKIDTLFPGRLVKQKSRDKHGCFESWAGDPDAMTDLHGFERSQNIKGTFIGIRAQENATRKLVAKRYGRWPYQIKNGQWHCNPIIDWSIRDIWAYIHSHDLPVNESYALQARAGLSLEEQRVIPFGYRKSLDIMRRTYPSLYNEVLIKYPKARMLS